MKQKKIWFKNKIIPISDALVSVRSPCFEYGLNVFEVIRGYWNNKLRQLYFFRLEDHIERLNESCQSMRMEFPYTFQEIVGFFKDITEANQIKSDTVFRLTVFIEGDGNWHAQDPASMTIIPSERPRLVIEDVVAKDACVSSWERISDRNMPPRIKTGANYINGRHAQLEAVANGYDLPILLNDQGNVSEGAGACLMIVRSGKLIAPPLSASVLDSITRRSLFEIAADLQIKAIERDITRNELYSAQEVFLCGTTPELMPIRAIDHIQIGDSLPGNITKLLMSEYHKAVCGETTRYLKWLIPAFSSL